MEIVKQQRQSLADMILRELLPLDNQTKIIYGEERKQGSVNSAYVRNIFIFFNLAIQSSIFFRNC